MAQDFKEDFSAAEKEFRKDGMLHGTLLGFGFTGLFLFIGQIALGVAIFSLLYLILLMVYNRTHTRSATIGFLTASMTILLICLALLGMLYLGAGFVAGTGGQ
jgi:hypothetical protein